MTDKEMDALYDALQFNSDANSHTICQLIVEVRKLRKWALSTPDIAEFPNMKQCAHGCTSGKWSEWPGLRAECKAALIEIDRLRVSRSLNIPEIRRLAAELTQMGEMSIGLRQRYGCRILACLDEKEESQ